jgi:hypothetical protein
VAPVLARQCLDVEAFLRQPQQTSVSFKRFETLETLKKKAPPSMGSAFRKVDLRADFRRRPLRRPGYFEES